jgi:hypothetical protein
MPALQSPVNAEPWWKNGHVWLVIAGPVASVVVSAGLIWAAVSLPDPVIDEDYYRHGSEINKELLARDKSLLPALKGRDHAATPPQDTPVLRR